MNTHRIISAAPSTNAAVHRAHRRIRRETGAILLKQIPALREIAAMAGAGSASAMQASSERLKRHVPSSREALEHAAIMATLEQDAVTRPGRIATACAIAIRITSDAVAMTEIDPTKMSALAAAHGVVGVLTEEREALVDPEVTRTARRFDPGIRGRVASLVSKVRWRAAPAATDAAPARAGRAERRAGPDAQP